MELTSLNGEHIARPFQIEGFEFLEKTPNGRHRENIRALIGDDTGLGKTVQALLALKNRPDLCPALIVVKAPTITQWNRMIRHWFKNDFTTVQIIRGGRQMWLPGFNIYLISMDTLRCYVNLADKDLPKLEPQFKEFINHLGGFQSIIFDEAQGIKNPDSARTQAFDAIFKLCGPEKVDNTVFNIPSGYQGKLQFTDDALLIKTEVPHFIALSATAITGAADEYYPVLSKLDPARFGDQTRFRLNWLEQDSKGKWSRFRRDKIAEFHKVSAEYIIRRKKKDVLKDLPKFERTFNFIKIDDVRIKKIYNQELDKMNKALSAQGVQTTSLTLSDCIATLRRIIGMAKALHIADSIACDYEDNQNAPKVVLGVHHQDAIALLTDSLTKSNIKYVVLDGQLNSQKKDEVLQKFRTDPSIKILILSMLAGGVGIDGIQHVSSKIITVERQWRAAHEEQFEGRVHRDGQKEPVTNEIYVAEGTIDEFMHERVKLTRKILNETLDNQIGDLDEFNIREAAEWAVSHRM